MFWGVTLEGGKKYSQKVNQSFRISMAALEIPVPEPSHVHSVYVELNQHKFLLCSLNQESGIYQVPLGVQFEDGTDLSFFVSGGSKKSRVHLTGHVLDIRLSMSSITSTPSSSAITIPIKAQQHSILVSDKKQKEKSGKRVSIQEKHEEKTFEKESDDDDDDLEDDDDDDDNGGMFQLDSGDEDDDEEEDEDEEDMDLEMFNLEDDDTDEIQWSESDTPQLEDEEPSYIEEIVMNGNAEAKRKASKKDKKLKANKLDFDDDEKISSSSETSSPKKLGKGKDTPVVTPPSKKQKLTIAKTKNQTPENNALNTPQQNEASVKTPSSVGNTPRKMLGKGGLMITELRIGNGIPAKAGKMVSVKYTGRLKKNNKQFDSGSIRIRLGKGEVIKGWDIGIEGMKEGGKRHIVIPPHLAYGPKGAPPDIPPNSALAFDLELTKVS